MTALPHEKPATKKDHGLACVLALGILLSALASWSVLSFDPERIGAGLRSFMPLVQAALLASLAIQALALVRQLRGRPSKLPLRVLFYALVLGTLLFLIFVQPFWAFYLHIASVVFWGVFALLALLAGSLAKLLPARLLRVGDLLLFNLCLLLVLAEGSLRLWQQIAPTPLLAATDSSTLERLDRYRLPPGSLHLGARVNSRGFYDEEFTAKKPGTKLVACIGDSYNVGVVPRELHYSSICEGASKKLRIDNYGIGGIGPSEYLLLLQRELFSKDAVARPDAVVISLFIGNDIAEAGKARVGQRFLRSIFDRGNLRLYLLPRRLLRIARERQARAGKIGSIQGEAQLRVQGPAAIRKQFPWIADPSLEKPTFSEANFLELIRRRARAVQASQSQAYARLEQDLREMQQICGKTPLYVLLQPAEWQVEDKLWQQLVATDNAREPLERDVAQRRTRQILDKLGIPYLDLLDTLRAVPTLPDGKRHLYHLRDTHYNARGNRVVGEALADFLRKRV